MRRLRPTIGLLALTALCLPASAQIGRPGAPPTGRPIVIHPDGTWSPVDEAAIDRERQLIDAAMTAIREGRIAEARDALGQVLGARELRDARAQLFAGEPADALRSVDRALEIDPRDRDAQELRARGLLALGEKMIVDGAGGVFVDGAFNDALKAFRGLGRTVAGRLGAARSAYMLNRSDAALSYAREASELLDREDGVAPDYLSAQRVIADATYLAYADAASAVMAGDGEADDREQALFPEAQDAVDELIAVAPHQVDTWQLAANLLLFRSSARSDLGAQADAVAALERGLEHLPTDRALLRRAVEIASGLEGGRASSTAVLDRFVERNPDQTFARQLRGLERFELAMADFPGRDRAAEDYVRAVERFRAAEDEFRHVRTTGGAGLMGADEAQSWEIICRIGIGWVRYWEGDLAAARAAFLATEELNPRGLEWEFAGRLESGIRGLQFVVSAHLEAEQLIEAAEIADILHARLPDDPNLANDAGFLNRDAALALANYAATLCRAARGEIDSPAMLMELADAIGIEPAAADPAVGDDATVAAMLDENLATELAAAARRAAERARGTMERSGAAYRVAARLAPDDVRVVNDTGLVYVYYLHTDLERAEADLRESVRLGAEQLAAEGLNEQAIYELKNAWGDAHENLGVHYLVHVGDLDAAEEWFLKAIEIGPDPRPIIDMQWLAQISARRAGAPADPDALRWVTDCE